MGTSKQTVQTPERVEPRPRLRQLDEETAVEACLATAAEFEEHGNEAAAIEQYLRARSHQDNLEGVARRLAVLYDRQGRDDLARREYTAALKEHPNDAELLNDYGYFHLQRGELAEAARLLKLAVDRDPELDRAWINLGLALAELRRDEEALAAFRRATTPAAAYHNLGCVLARLGDADAARSAFAHAVQLDGQQSRSRELLAQLETGPGNATPSNRDGGIRQVSHETRSP